MYMNTKALAPHIIPKGEFIPIQTLSEYIQKMSIPLPAILEKFSHKMKRNKRKRQH